MYSELTVDEEIDQEQHLTIAPVQQPSVKPNISPNLYEDCTGACSHPGCLRTCNKVKGHHGSCDCGKH
ncbi:hypothetical protein HDF10_001190 [Edaphobacter lichenicola]|uniref:Uncharacterized protein n=1 Tax=Tunturiibacter lichenicola TaxID=2051959 RepID=A0A7W8J648_9BACT|nr:hypothetical protein [Edaphobacter lichenicola]